MDKQQQWKITGKEKQSSHQQRNSVMIVNNKHISGLCVSINGINSPIKIQDQWSGSKIMFNSLLYSRNSSNQKKIFID